MARNPWLQDLNAFEELGWRASFFYELYMGTNQTWTGANGLLIVGKRHSHPIWLSSGTSHNSAIIRTNHCNSCRCSKQFWANFILTMEFIPSAARLLDLACSLWSFAFTEREAMCRFPCWLRRKGIGCEQHRDSLSENERGTKFMDGALPARG